MFCGFWVLVGLLLFIIVEKVFTAPNPYEKEDTDTDAASLPVNNNNVEDKNAKVMDRPSHEKVCKMSVLSIAKFTY